MKNRERKLRDFPYNVKLFKKPGQIDATIDDMSLIEPNFDVQYDEYVKHV